MKSLIFFKNKKVLVTGHTGFKGSWLSLWLSSLGAKVVGISIDNQSKNSHFTINSLGNKIYRDIRSDVRNLQKLKKIILKHKPDIIFHLAAQSLVKKSYNDPVKTFTSNSVGTLNILESLRFLKKRCTAIIITSDKSYKNLEISRGYKENDLLGGKDPYSASKASAELIIQSYIDSFFSKKNSKIRVGVARAGNVIGGGDWSKDRLIPDCVKAWGKNKKAIIRNPKSTRPWQHVLEVLFGYLIFAKKLSNNSNFHGEVFNFGPSKNNNFTVIQLVKKINKFWKKISWKIKNEKDNMTESKLLKLNSGKARKLLKWKTVLNFDETIYFVSDWYKNYFLKNKKIISEQQLKKFEKILEKRINLK